MDVRRKLDGASERERESERVSESGKERERESW